MYSLSRDIQHRLFRPKVPDYEAFSEDEILRWLLRFKYDPAFRARGVKTVPLATFVEYAGLSRTHVYEFMRGLRPLGVGSRARLTSAISAVQAGLRWHRTANHNYVMNDPGTFAMRYDRLPL